MIKPYVMTVEQVKTKLKITTPDQDADITSALKDVTDILFRKNGLCNQSFLYKTTCDTDTSSVLKNVNLSSKEWCDLYEGSQVLVNGIENEIESFDDEMRTITLTVATTGTEELTMLYIRNFPEGYKLTVSKMVMYLVSQAYAGSYLEREIESESMGGVSFKYALSDSDSLDHKWNLPSSLVRQLSGIKKPRFY